MPACDHFARFRLIRSSFAVGSGVGVMVATSVGLGVGLGGGGCSDGLGLVVAMAPEPQPEIRIARANATIGNARNGIARRSSCTRLRRATRASSFTPTGRRRSC